MEKRYFAFMDMDERGYAYWFVIDRETGSTVKRFSGGSGGAILARNLADELNKTA